MRDLLWVFDDDAERAEAVYKRCRRSLIQHGKQKQQTFLDVVEVMGGDRQRAQQLVEQNPFVLSSTLVASAFEDVVSRVMAGDRDQVRQLVERDHLVEPRSRRPPRQFQAPGDMSEA